MSDLSSKSCGRDNNCDNGFSPILLILLLTMCGGNNGILGGCGGNNGFGGCNNGLDGILPLILILSLCGGSL
jgi:hypothetical protein